MTRRFVSTCGDGPPIRTQSLADESVLAVLRDLGDRVRNVGVPVTPVEKPIEQLEAVH